MNVWKVNDLMLELGCTDSIKINLGPTVMWISNQILYLYLVREIILGYLGKGNSPLIFLFFDNSFSTADFTRNMDIMWIPIYNIVLLFFLATFQNENIQQNVNSIL